MGTSADINIDRLQDATGVLSSSLSDHHPSGGSPTYLGGFLVDDIGGNHDPQGSDTINSDFLIPVVVEGSAVDGSYEGDDLGGNFEFSDGTVIQTGDTFRVELWMETQLPGFSLNEEPGDLAPEAIFSRFAHWTFNTTGITIKNIERFRDGQLYESAVFVCEMSEYNEPIAFDATFDAKLNDDMPRNQTVLKFQTADVEKDFSVTLTAQAASSTSIGLNYEISGGVSDWSVTINRTSPSFQEVLSTTQTSEGTYSTTDDGLDDSKTYDYELIVVDESGNGDQRTDTASASPVSST